MSKGATAASRTVMSSKPLEYLNTKYIVALTAAHASRTRTAASIASLPQFTLNDHLLFFLTRDIKPKSTGCVSAGLLFCIFILLAGALMSECVGGLICMPRIIGRAEDLSILFLPAGEIRARVG